jgi:hypothetical protein
MAAVSMSKQEFVRPEVLLGGALPCCARPSQPVRNPCAGNPHVRFVLHHNGV